MMSFKKHFVSNLSTNIKKKLDKQWIIKEVDSKNLDQEKMEVDLMKNPFGKEPPELVKNVKFSRNNELLEGKELNTKVEF
jgi:hypothetical protein